MGVFLNRYGFAAALVFLIAATAVFAGLVRGEIRHRLGHFDAGKTIAINIGEEFTVTLERKVDENAKWIWPMVQEEIVKLVTEEPETTREGDQIKETYTFVGVALGATDVFAELVRPDDYTDVLKRYAFKVQVVP
ncbi:MAG: hypothetical protein ACTSXZ_08325 [Alphaproteobacteria bacterium]